MEQHQASPRGGSARYVVIALVACAILLLEVTATRLLSVVLWYHFAFLSVSLAMLGLGVPGVWFALKRPGVRLLDRSLWASAAVIPLCILLILHAGAMLPWASGVVERPLGLVAPRVLLSVLCILVPLLALGTALVLLLLEAKGPAFARMYAADLVGASVGAALAVPFMYMLPTPALMTACGLLPLVALWVLRRRLPVAGWVLGAAILGILIWNEPLQLRYTKNYKEDGLILEKWTPTARIGVFSNVFWRRKPATAFGWGMGTRFHPYPIRQLWMEQDGSAGTPITRLDRPIQALEHLFYDVTSVAYQWRPPARVCVIGAGGGRDVLTALGSGAESIDAVELCGGIVDLIRNEFREFSGDLYRRPEVAVHVAEGRSFLSGKKTRWDLIQISLTDSFAATAAGAFSLSENHLYTVEAARLYLRRLTPEGVLSISRWTRLGTGLEAPRLVLLLQRALELEGFERPLEHMAVIQGGILGTVLVSPTAISIPEIARLDSICTERGFTRMWPQTSAATDSSIIAEVMEKGAERYTEMGFDLSAPTDDRPFFFQLVSVLGRVDPTLAQKLSVHDSAVVLLRWLVVFMTGITLLLFLLPFALAGKMQRGNEFWRGSAYFAAIGVGFMAVEIALIQRFILFLGHPSYATTVVVAGVLLGAGAGSLAATRITPRGAVRWGFILPLALGAVVLLRLALLARGIGWPLPIRVVITLAELLPLGFLMGLAFPTGMAHFGETSKAWFWAMNGVAGVLAGVLSLTLAMRFGFDGVLLFGGAMYLIAWMLLARSPRRLKFF